MLSLRCFSGKLMGGVLAAAILLRLLLEASGGTLPVHLLRGAFYVALVIAWGLSVRWRILHVPTRHCLMGVAWLLALWLFLRIVKWHFVTDPSWLRCLWYAYYLPILVIPLLCFFVAFSLGHSENYVLPSKVYWAAVPTFVFLLLVGTNDAHQLVFQFPEGTVWTDKAYTYGLAYWLLFGWVLLCSLASLGIMAAKARIAQKKGGHWLPLVPLGLAFLYSAAYALHLPQFAWLYRDMTVVLCLLILCALELCIQCGLIRSNRNYAELFCLSSVNVQLVDNDYVTYLASKTAKCFSVQDMQRAKEKPVLLEGSIRLSSAGVSQGGRVFWQEDLSELAALIEKLALINEQLRALKGAEAADYQTKRAKEHLSEQNRLFREMLRQTEGSIWLYTTLVERLAQSQAAAERQRLVLRVVLLAAYLKRSNNLVFLAENDPELPSCELAYCVKETLNGLKLAVPACGMTFEVSRKLALAEVARLYDAFHAVVMASVDTLQSLYAYFRPDGAAIIMEMNLVTAANLSLLGIAGLETEEEDGEWTLLLRVEKGGRQNVAF